MKSPQLDIPRVILQPGQLFFTHDPTQVTTILGSCVAVTMFHLHTRFAGICHALLPEGSAPPHPCEGVNDGYKFVDSVIRAMFNFFERFGIPRKQIKVKVFGGGDVLEISEGSTGVSVGKKNIAATSKLLDEYGIIPAAVDVGGVYGRKLHFITHTGDVYIKKLARNDLSKLPGAIKWLP